MNMPPEMKCFKNNLFYKIIDMLILIDSVFLVGTLFLAVVNRYFIHYTMPWSTEIVKLLFVWLTFLAGSLGIKEERHIGVNFLGNIISSPKIGKAINLLTEVIIMCFCISMSIYSFLLTWKVYKFAQVSTNLGLSYALWYLAMPVGFILMSVFTLIKILNLVRKQKLTEGSELYKEC